MHRGDAPVLIALLLAACGGGGGSTPPVVPQPVLRIGVEDVEIGTGTNQVDLVVRLVSTPAESLSLLEVAIELPTELTLPATDRLVASTAVTNLDGDFVANRFVVLCGDAENSDPTALRPGDLFRLRLQPSAPRTPGSYPVRFVNLRGASRNGTDAVSVDSAPVTATVVVR